MNNLIIGIAGGSGSGKTTLALRLKERFGEDEVRLISHDSYYKRHDELPFEERCRLSSDTFQKKDGQNVKRNIAAHHEKQGPGI